MLGKIAVRIIDLYQQIIRPGMPSVCRFWPTCSEYTKQGIVKYGFLKGVIKGTGRILHCHPLSHKYGYDPLE